jgi:hypothetical protein
MHTKKILGGTAIAAATLGLAAAPAVAGATLPKVKVRVEGKHRTLLRSVAVRPKAGWVTRYGAPRHACSTDTVQGALGAATRGHWKGTWSAQYHEYFITGILGETHGGAKYYWEVFVNHVAASAGTCDIKLRKGQQILFAAVPSTGQPELPIGITAPRTAKPGVPFTVHVVLYNAAGKAHSLKGATVSGGTLKATTNGHGDATLVATHTGRLVLTARHSGDIRDEKVVRVSL